MFANKLRANSKLDRSNMKLAAVNKVLMLTLTLLFRALSSRVAHFL